MNDTSPTPGAVVAPLTTAAAGDVAEQLNARAPERVPRLVGVVWILLLVNTLGYTQVDLIVPLTRSVAQMITMGSLAAAFLLALVLNPRVRISPTAYLLILSLLAVLSVASSLRLESGLGSLLRCGRMCVFVVTLWLVSQWFRGDLYFARVHIRALGGVLLTVLVGLIISPGSAFSGPDGRLVGAIWPIPAPQVGQYCAVAIGLAVMLWFTKRLDGTSTAVVAVPAVSLLLLSHTRTALLGMVVGVLLAGLTFAATTRRARRCLAASGATVAVVCLLFSGPIQQWLSRGQDAEELADLTGRAKVWNLLLAKERTISEELFGLGLSDKSFAGLPIDNSWLSIYHEQGWVGIGLVAAYLLALLGAVALHPNSPARGCALFLIIYCLSASYTEVGLGDVSPYFLHLAVAASLLARRAPLDPVRPA